MNKKGYGLVVVIFIMLAFAVLTIGFVSLLFSETRLAVEENRYNQAFFLAEAGKNYAAQHLANYVDWSQALGLPLTKQFTNGCFTIDSSEETSSALILYSNGLMTAEGKTYQRVFKMRMDQVDYDGMFGYSLYFGNAAGTDLEIEDSTIYGDIFVNGETEVDDDSVVANGLVYYNPGGTVEGDGVFTAEVITEVPSWPAFNNSYYTGLISAYRDSWVGAADNWTISAGAYNLTGQTIRKNVVNIRGTARITGFGVITTTNYVDVFENAVIEPDPGKTIALVGQNWVKIRDNATVYPKVIMYSQDQSVLIHDPEVEVYGALAMSSTKIDIYDAAVVTGESVAYLPPDAVGKGDEYSVFELEHDSTFNGSIIVEAAADKKIRLDRSDFTGLVYVPNAKTVIKYMEIAGTIMINKVGGEGVYHSVLSGGLGNLPSTIPQGFTGGGSAVGGVVISEWEEVL